LSKLLQYDYIQVGDTIDKVIVAIHGWQGDKTSMNPIIRMLKIENTGYYLLEAPYTVDQGEGRSWSYKKSNGMWEVKEPKKLLQNFFSFLFDKFSSENIYVVGFSQGAMVCLEFVLFLDYKLGGVFPICGFLRQPELNINRIHPIQKNTPILIGHGEEDDIVPAVSSQIAYDLLSEQGANVELVLYRGRHKISVDYMKKMKKIIENEN